MFVSRVGPATFKAVKCCLGTHLRAQLSNWVGAHEVAFTTLPMQGIKIGGDIDVAAPVVLYSSYIVHNLSRWLPPGSDWAQQPHVPGEEQGGRHGGQKASSLEKR